MRRRACSIRGRSSSILSTADVALRRSLDIMRKGGANSYYDLIGEPSVLVPWHVIPIFQYHLCHVVYPAKGLLKKYCDVQDSDKQ